MRAEMIMAMELSGVPSTSLEKSAAAVESLNTNELKHVLLQLGVQPDNRLQKIAQAESRGRELARLHFEKQALTMPNMTGQQAAGRFLLGAVEKGKDLRNAAVGAGLGAAVSGGRALLKKPGVDPNTGEQQSRLGNAARSAVGGALAGGVVGASSRQLVGGLASMNNRVGAGMRGAMGAGAETLSGQAQSRAQGVTSALGFASKRRGLADRVRGMDRTPPSSQAPVGGVVPGGGASGSPSSPLRSAPPLETTKVIQRGGTVAAAPESSPSSRSMSAQDAKGAIRSQARKERRAQVIETGKRQSGGTQNPRALAAAQKRQSEVLSTADRLEPSRAAVRENNLAQMRAQSGSGTQVGRVGSLAKRFRSLQVA